MMVEDDFSCIKEVTKVVHLALPSIYTSNEIAGVSDILESWKRQFIPQLQGVVVSYKNVSLASKSGFVVVDKPFVHYDVKATFELFCPVIGSIVKGKINRISHDYIGCLVHNTINAAVKRSLNAPERSYKFTAVDRIILFKITCFDYRRKVIRLKGELTEECVSLMEELSPFNTVSEVFQDSQSSCVLTSELGGEASSSNSSKESDDSQFEDKSASFFEPDFKLPNDGSHVFNIDHLTGRTSSSADSSSQESDLSSPEQNYAPSKKKSKRHKIANTLEQDAETKEPKETIGKTIDAFKLPAKKKKKHKDKKSKDKSAKKAGSQKKKEIHLNNEHSSPVKKKSQKSQFLSHNNFIDSTTSGIETSDEMKSLHSPKKKKSSKNAAQSTSNLHESLLADISVKEEIPKDLEFLQSPKKKKSKKQKVNITENNSVGSPVYNTMDVLNMVMAGYEPSHEKQSPFSKIFGKPETIDSKQQSPFSELFGKPKTIDSDKKDRKRKRESLSEEDLPSKKIKSEKHRDVSLKNKLHKKGEKKKKKEKSKKSLKKEKKKKKALKSKKDKLSYKIKKKKNMKSSEKSKGVKQKKSKNKASKVPSSNPVKLEVN